MQLNPYGADGVRLAVDLAVDRPDDLGALVATLRRHAVVLDRSPVAADLAEVHRATDDWVAVVDAPDAAARAALLNAMAERYCSAPSLTDHAGTGWHVHYRPGAITVGRQVGALMAAGTILHLAGRGMTRLGRCAAGGCGRPYADHSRTGRQRYCSPACANRDAVRRHRARAAS